ncbi:flagellar hook-basal body complex protein [Pelagicoccus sp. SDUM812003]|uniref:flagellar hook-basal body complex protein n=1 Tax=Pelagicoccus sp. SDUM812003 TaxID=3041267 RepID=UPI0028103B95|nr:flagellar hook-basal body complex protein [Pelagicoccus sp. SDUM812003]MDQ8202538.1 flagellar hook-basal body complex protein [Pelagicoccus sp. SDUM812003]
MAFGALSSGISALTSFSKGMEVIGNNIANVNTVSFKSSRIKYSETFNQVLQQSAPSPNGTEGSNVQASQVGLGVQVEGIVGQFHQGGLSATNQLTDLAISGEGFFLVNDPRNNDAEYATRGGDFRIDDNGYLVTSSGMRVQGMTGGSIGFEVDVNADGEWSFVPNLDSQTGTIDPFEIGDIRLDYNKDDAGVVGSQHLEGNMPREAVMFTNELISHNANEVATWGSIGVDDATGDMKFIYGADELSAHRVGAFVMSEDGGNIEGVTGWHAFMESAVADLTALRNKSVEGVNGGGVVTDAEIKQAVSSDFFYRMFSGQIETQNTANAANADNVIAAYNAANGTTHTAADMLADASLETAALAAYNPSEANLAAAYNTANGTSITAADFATDPSLRAGAITAWNAANPGSPYLSQMNVRPIEIDGNAVQHLFVDNGDLSWDSTIDFQGTVNNVVSTYPNSLSEAEALIAQVRADKTPDLSRFAIDSEGSIKYFLSNGDSFERGRVMLVDFNDKTALIREGQNLYSSFGAAGLKAAADNNDGLHVAGRNGLGLIKQGALELSNVDLTNEFANMITTQRGFQAGSRIITVSDDILQEVVNLKR